jgi:hypothetical protein
MLSGSCCVILGSRSVRRTCNHRFAETDAGGWQAGKRGISGPSYDEVTGIFVRVNSLGAKLRSSDLALAQIPVAFARSPVVSRSSMILDPIVTIGRILRFGKDQIEDFHGLLRT